MNPDIYRAAMSGDWETIKSLCTDFRTHKTPNGNTILHVLAEFSDSFADAVKEIAAQEPGLVYKKNKRGETPLVIASRRGYANVARALIDSAKSTPEKPAGKMMLAQGYDWALEEAVRNNRYEVVKLMVVEEEGPDTFSLVPVISTPWRFTTPLYLAAEKGCDDIVALLLSRTFIEIGPEGKTALHAAALRNSLECMKLILKTQPLLTKRVDPLGWSALHCASMVNHSESVKLLLSKDSSLGYLRVKTDDNMTALHIAVSRGHLDVVREILLHCPDCWEMVTHYHQNILHLAVKNEHKKVLEFILETSWGFELINEKDVKGNTPLHLYVSTNSLDGNKLVNHSFVDKDAMNNAALTPLDIIEEADDELTERQNFIREELLKAGATPTLRNSYLTLAFKTRPRRGRVKVENMEMYMIVATLIVTVTFAAGFTIPGGYDNTAGNEGKAVLSKHAGFAAFVVSDSLAMLLSIIALLQFFILMNQKPAFIFAVISDEPFTIITFSLSLSLGLTAIAFLTGLYVVLPTRALKTYLIVVGSCIGLSILPFLLVSLISYIKLLTRPARMRDARRLMV